MGNLLNSGDSCYITDLGLCRPANETDQGKIYGVIPYMAPEIFLGETYTFATDIYSFGIVMYEMFSELPPYVIHDEKTNSYREMPHDGSLVISICRGLRPNIDDVRIPQQCKDLIKQCWDANPEERPLAAELENILGDWFIEVYTGNSGTEFYQQYQAIEAKKNEKLNFSAHQTHPQAIYTSRLLEFENLPKPQNGQEINDQFWNSKVDFPLTELQRVLEDNEQENKISFAAWLRDFKHLTLEQVLNHGNEAELRVEFQAYQNQTEIPPKK